MPFWNNFNSPAKEQILLSYRNCRLPTDSSQLTGYGSKLDARSLSSLPLLLSRLTRARRLGLASRARLPRSLQASPAGTAPHARAAAAGTRRPPGTVFLGELASSRARPTYLCLLHKERQRCDPAQAAVWQLRLAVLELRHTAWAAAADSPRIEPERNALSTARVGAAIPVPARGGERSPGRRAASTFIRLPPAYSGHASFPSGAPGKQDRAGAGEREGRPWRAAGAPEVGQIKQSAFRRWGAGARKAGRPLGRGGA